MKARRIKTYRAFLTRERDKRLTDDVDHLDFDEYIVCKGYEDSQSVRIYFLLNETIPKSFTSDDRWYAFMPAKQYVYALDLFRNEAPVTVWLEEETGQFLIGTSGFEPVGEGPGELVP